MEILNEFLASSEIPLLSAFVLGLMTAISPCPLATNITAIGFISKDIEDRKRVFLNGLVYTLGRVITYTAIGFALYFGASKFHISGFLQEWGEKLLGPLMIIIGLFMLGVINPQFSFLDGINAKMEEKSKNGFWGVLLLGIVFALAFCPYSGVLYFGMLIPMTVSTPNGLILPISFAIATGIPVIIFAWLIAFSMGSIGGIYNKIKVFESRFRMVVAYLFIVFGCYQIYSVFFA